MTLSFSVFPCRRYFSRRFLLFLLSFGSLILPSRASPALSIVHYYWFSRHKIKRSFLPHARAGARFSFSSRFHDDALFFIQMFSLKGKKKCDIFVIFVKIVENKANMRTKNDPSIVLFTCLHTYMSCKCHKYVIYV